MQLPVAGDYQIDNLDYSNKFSYKLAKKKKKQKTNLTK